MHNQISGATGLAKFAIGLCLAITTAFIATFVGAFFWVYTSTAAHAKQIEALEKAREKAHAEGLAELDKARKRYDDLAQGHNRLRQYVNLLWAEQPNRPAILEAMVYRGHVQWIRDKKLAILPLDLGEPVIIFPIADNTQIRIKNREAKLTEVEPLMQVHVETANGKILAVVVD